MAKQQVVDTGSNSTPKATSQRGIIRTILVFLAFHGIYVIFPFAFILTPFILIYTGKVIAGSLFLGAYCLWFAISYPDEKLYGRPWPWFENLPIFQFLFDYFPFAIVRAIPSKNKNQTNAELPPLDPKGLFVFAVHPHGTLALNRGLFGFSTNTLWDKVFPGVNFRVLTATAALRLPVIREMYVHFIITVYVILYPCKFVFECIEALFYYLIINPLNVFQGGYGAFVSMLPKVLPEEH